MNTKTILNKIRTALQMEVKLETMELSDGTIIEADVFEPDAEVFIMSGENRVALPVGEYKLVDGTILIVLNEGIIAEMKAPESEEEAPTEEAPAPEMAEEPQLEETAPKKVIDSISREQFFEEIQKLTAHFNEVLDANKKTELAEEPKKEELKEEPTEKVTHSPEKVVKTELEFKAPKGTKSRKQRIIEKLNK